MSAAALVEIRVSPRVNDQRDFTAVWIDRGVESSHLPLDGFDHAVDLAAGRDAKRLRTLWRICEAPKPRLRISVEREFDQWCVAFYFGNRFYRRVYTDNEAAARAELNRLVAAGTHELREVCA